jgi:manganese/iron transport system substrate-binding protein
MLRCFHSNTPQLWGAILLAFAVGLTGCSSGNQATNQTQTETRAASTTASKGKPKVIASYSVVCDLTESIAADSVDLTCLVDPEADPHTYQATPADRKAIETAQLILYGGYDFEPTIVNLVQATKNSAPKLAVNEQAVPKPLMGEAHEHEGEEHAHESGEAEHESGEMAADPHVWHDAENGIRMVEVIRNQLQKVAPEHQELYERNAQQLSDELKQVDTWIQAQINTIPPQQRKLVTTHDALGYYANAYGLKIERTLQGFSTEEQPTAARLRELVKEVKSTNVPTIFAEVTANDKVSRSKSRT